MNELQQLVGLILPKQVSWWPLAPGWYVLLTLVMCIVLLLIYKRRKNFIKNHYRREALLLLQQYSICNGAKLLPLLQKVTENVCPEPVELQQNTFIAHLNAGLKEPLFNLQDWLLLTQLAFQPLDVKEQTQQHSDLENRFTALKAKCRQWIEGHHYEY